MAGTVYPVYDNEFAIGTSGLASTTEQMVAIANLETFGLSIDGTIENWNPMEAKGWAEAMLTGKKLSISFKGKRTVGDAGNDYVAGLTWKLGNDVVTLFKWTFPTGAKVEFPCVVDVKNSGGGDSTNVEPLEFDVHCKGKPTYTAAT